MWQIDLLNDPLYSAPEVPQTSPLFLPFHPSGRPSLPPNTQHRGCAWLKHYNSSRKWPFLRNFQGAVKGRRLMPGQALQGTGTPPLLSSLPISFTPLPLSSHHPHTANDGMSHANETLSNRITLNASARVHLVKSCFADTLLAFCYSGKIQQWDTLRSLLIIPFGDVFFFIPLWLIWWGTWTSSCLSSQKSQSLSSVKGHDFPLWHKLRSFCRENVSTPRSL